MSNRIVINNYIFNDEAILSANAYISNAPISEELQSDTFECELIGSSIQMFLTSEQEQFVTADGYNLVVGSSFDFETLIYGRPVEFYHDNELIGKFFVKQIIRTGRNTWKVECISAIGLLSYIDHYGGIYGVTTTMTVGTLLADIIGNIPVTIDSSLNTVPIKGYLPKATARDNLRQVLFAIGASVLKDASGNLVIKYNQPETAKSIQKSNIYIGTEIKSLTKATSVILVEHSYYVGANTQAEEVYNSLSSETEKLNEEVVFSQPYYDYVAYDSQGNNITSSFITDSGANFIVVGTSSYPRGRVVAKSYIHTQRQITKNTGVSSIEDNVVSVTDATLVSPLNSTNCLERIASYYGGANEISMGIVYDDEKSGQLVTFENLYDETQTQVGYIKSLDITASKNLKAESRLAINWLPNHLGNTYNRYVLIDSTSLGGLTATWIPQDAEGNSLVGKEAYVVMFNGSNGGNGGYDGSSGTNASGVATEGYIYDHVDVRIITVYQPVNAGVGGSGGAGGSAGSSCSRYNSAILTLGSSYQISLGAGGSGGSRNGGSGGVGGVTNFGPHTSNVHDLTSSYVNIVDGSVYCQNGINGENGGKGGNGGTASKSKDATVFANAGENGGSTTSYNGGQGTQGSVELDHNIQRDITWYSNVGGGGGGGASANANGTNATACDTNATDDHRTIKGLVCTKKGGNGGNGASAIQPTKSILGQGGHGGNGGGGGGGAGASMSWSLNPTLDYGEPRPWASGGSGGQGSKGGDGSDGFIIVYYTEV